MLSWRLGTKIPLHHLTPPAIRCRYVISQTSDEWQADGRIPWLSIHEVDNQSVEVTRTELGSSPSGRITLCYSWEHVHEEVEEGETPHVLDPGIDAREITAGAGATM